MTTKAAPSSDVDRGTTYRSVWRSLLDTDFRQGHIDALGLRTRYVRAGDPGRPTVVMLHGTGGHWETFSPTIPALSDEFDCVAFDMLGCGFTDKPDRPYEIKDYVEHALAVLDALDIEAASFIGVSLGSWVTCRLAADLPARVRSMVLNSPAGLLPMSAAATAAVSTRRERSVDPSWSDTETILEHLFYDRSSLVDDIVAVRQQVYSLPAPSSQRTLTLFDPEVRRRNLLSDAEWRSIEVPALVVAHVDSPDDYLDTAHEIATLMPNAQLVEMRQVSHWPHFERPEDFNPVALEFLRATTTSGGR